MKDDRAIVFAGPPGCGKFHAARQVGARAGRFVEIDAERLGSVFQSWLCDDVASVIVDGLPNERVMKSVLPWLTHGFMQVEKKGREPSVVRSPNFIFCTDDLDAARHLNPRVFRVIWMGLSK